MESTPEARRSIMPEISEEDVAVNTFALRSFRDTADRDYVHARLAYKAQLVPQFQWSSLHCLEKYAKGILILNRISAKDLRHEVTNALERLAKKGKFSISLSTPAQKFIERLESGAEDRYFTIPYSNEMHDIVLLDLSVSELRRYCQVLDRTFQAGQESLSLLERKLGRINHAAEHSPHDTCIKGGWLERVLKEEAHPARSALVWNNLFFTTRRRKRVRLHGFIEAANSELYLNPKILDVILEYVHLPGRIVNELRQEFKDAQSLP